MWVLRIEAGSFARAASALKPALHTHSKKKKKKALILFRIECRQKKSENYLGK